MGCRSCNSKSIIDSLPIVDCEQFPFGVVNRYLWATGLDKAPEMRQLHDATVSNGHTYTFLKSVTATLPRPVSDLAEAESHRKMAKQWYGLTLDEEI